ncbi:unnamed protein product [Kuraishia capsulata CBS 1993]|uniref:Inclusion body clearance protein IML2 n=1 Tax=Kuraishia capsulata CBS 1993 TaxID=1382522 RepID=W6MR26_9ASCO|nr:uncharacterized protein KUCA_T00005148001 [Kuraishia capsulata CBS 1993]CDK29161.1 unnamed protein product [Kuraishia capsulata CBS 1993]
MLRALGLKRAESIPDLSQAEKTDRVITEATQYEVALRAMDYLLDDRASEGMDLIKNEDGAIYQLALGVIQFLEATLGFEPETMKKAHETLSVAESKCWKEKTTSEKYRIRSSSIYPPGTEWAVTYAEANLLSALLMLLSESVVESAKALFKLRKAYHTLDEISRNMATVENGSGLGTKLNESSASLASSAASKMFAEISLPLDEQQLKDEAVIRRCERLYAMRKNRMEGSHIGNSSLSERLRPDLGMTPGDTPNETTDDSTQSETSSGHSDVSTIDEFIHSGVNLCFGILQVVLSLIPPAIGKVLSVVGFKGSREAGLKMCWKASEERNIHGGIALLALLVFYDGPFQFTDVDFDVPSSEELTRKVSTLSVQRSSTLTSAGESLRRTLSRKKMALEARASAGVGAPTLLHPGPRLATALLHARAIFPNSSLWLLQEGRMLASRGRLEEAVDLMDSSSRKAEMVQIDALLIFDRAMILVFLHKYERAAREFIKLVEINSWSHALYFYFAGACYLEAYRMCHTGLLIEGGKDNIVAEKKSWYAKEAERYLSEAPDLIGKRKFMAKTMPFDKFLARKVKAIKAVASKTALPFVDAVGTSLVHELCYFWNGYGRMPGPHLELSIKLLGYSASNPEAPYALTKPDGTVYAKFSETKEESLIRYTLQTMSLRRLGKIEEGSELLNTRVICNLTESGTVDVHAKSLKLTENPWCYPTALYERALFTWREQGIDGLAEVKNWLKKSQAFGGDDYELSTRVGMKTKAALDRLEGLQ